MKFCWVTINVKDMEESLRFYREVVGLELDRSMKPNPGMELAFLSSGGTQVELIRDSKGRSYGAGDGISLGFEVDSLEKTIESLKGKNIPLHSGPFQPNPSVKFAYVLDPDGVKIQFIQNLR
jgi:lactoylglutathione lyase